MLRRCGTSIIKTPFSFNNCSTPLNIEFGFFICAITFLAKMKSNLKNFLLIDKESLESKYLFIVNIFFLFAIFAKFLAGSTPTTKELNFFFQNFYKRSIITCYF